MRAKENGIEKRLPGILRRKARRASCLLLAAAMAFTLLAGAWTPMTALAEDT